MYLFKSIFLKLPLLLYLCLNSIGINAQVDSSFYNLSLKELGNITVQRSASIVYLSETESPASISYITKSDIEITPARNIYDLIETYVPGALWLNHEEGPHVGVRGVISNRNHQYLLLVNGRNLNNKAHYGAKSELEQWQLHDIERIEIIRGSGSVTFGPGAVGGVINIITKTAVNNSGIQANIGYNGNYNSKQANISYGVSKGNLNLYAFASVSSTPGIEANHLIGTKNDGFGIIGQDVNTTERPLHYFGDAYNTPQIKTHLNIELGNNFKFWTRYTQQGSHWAGNEVKTKTDDGVINQQSTQDRQFTATFLFEKKLKKKMNLEATVSFDSYDAQRISDNDRISSNFQHVLNKKNNFAENELFARSVLSYKFQRKSEIAIGIEYAFDHFGSGWGESANTLRMGDESNIVNGSNSLAILDGNGGSAAKKGKEVFVGNGWSTSTISIFLESKIALPRRTSILVSGRIDKNFSTNFLYSPRVAIIKKIKKKQTLKLIGQQSVRANTASQVYLEDLQSNPTSSEKLVGTEIIYTNFITENTRIDISSFINKINLFTFQGDINASAHVGDLIVSGAEIDFKKKSKIASIGVSYSYTKQLSWEMNESFTRTSVSYSDYNEELLNENGNSYTLTSSGNDLNNWANQALKMYTNINLKTWWKAHLDFKLLFDYQGSKDGVEAVRKTLENSTAETYITTQVNIMDQHKIFESNYQVNISTSMQLGSHLKLTIFAQNILNNYKRYIYAGGHSDATFRKVRIIEEPFMLGTNLNFKF